MLSRRRSILRALEWSDAVHRSRTTWALATYALIVFAFRVGIAHTPIAASLGVRLPYALASFVLLLAPLWFFGFGAGDWLRAQIKSRAARILLPCVLGVPGLLFEVFEPARHWQPVVLMFVLPMILATLLDNSSTSPLMSWQDGAVLASLVAIYMTHLLQPAWPENGLAALPKLYVADLVLYLYVVVRRLEGMGYSLIPTRSAVLIGFREWAFYAPIGIGLGLALHFIHSHRVMPSPLPAGAAIFGTFLLIAIPEEMFFRGVLQNLFETRLGRTGALLLAAVFFGLSHFNKRAVFNWKYVILATLAGIFYGRAWRANRQILPSAITHTAVDVVWSLWFR
jgi:membrane protease YdiL (CAAX protease family)